MFALGQKADIHTARRHVSFTPIADMKWQIAPADLQCGFGAKMFLCPKTDIKDGCWHAAA
jgi:hypothetical protein